MLEVNAPGTDRSADTVSLPTAVSVPALLVAVTVHATVCALIDDGTA
jgi:hypothetical protein